MTLMTTSGTYPMKMTQNNNSGDPKCTLVKNNAKHLCCTELVLWTKVPLYQSVQGWYTPQGGDTYPLCTGTGWCTPQTKPVLVCTRVRC